MVTTCDEKIEKRTGLEDFINKEIKKGRCKTWKRDIVCGVKLSGKLKTPRQLQ